MKVISPRMHGYLDYRNPAAPRDLMEGSPALPLAHSYIILSVFHFALIISKYANNDNYKTRRNVKIPRNLLIGKA